MKIDFFAGLDEAGRGPLAGPVSAACVIVPHDFPLEFLNDSKKLTEKKRLAAYDVIIEKCLWGYGQVEHDEIDRINILKASLKAMKIAYDDMLTKIGEWCKKNSYDLPSIPEDICAVCDGTFVPEINCSVFSEPKADGKYPCVMAASIIAKVNRDRLMVEKKISLNVLAEKVGITNVNLSKIKNNKVNAIRFSTLEKICEILDCSPGDILKFEK